MATDKDVNINIKTKTNAKGLKDANKELQKLSKTITLAERTSKDLRKEAVKLEKTNEKAAKAWAQFSFTGTDPSHDNAGKETGEQMNPPDNK